MITGDGKFVYGKRTRAVEKTAHPERYSHACAGMVVVRPPEDRVGRWPNDLDPQTGIPDLFLAAQRECDEETGCKIRPEDVTFCCIINNYQLGIVDVYGWVEVADLAEDIRLRPKKSKELEHHWFDFRDPSDIEPIIKHVATEPWVPEDRLGVLFVLAAIAHQRWELPRSEDWIFSSYRAATATRGRPN